MKANNYPLNANRTYNIKTQGTTKMAATRLTRLPQTKILLQLQQLVIIIR